MKLFKMLILTLVASFIVGCGTPVEVPPAHVGKVVTRDGYSVDLVPTSKFRLDPCLLYCDKLILLGIDDRTYEEKDLKIFIPEDKLNLTVTISSTLSIDVERVNELFAVLTPREIESYLSIIDAPIIYQTYASKIIQTEVREYLSQFSIGEIASSIEKINSDIRQRLTEVIGERTPFKVRYIGLTNIQYPKIITDAQEQAAERREAIQREEAQLRISEVRLNRELQEAQLQRAIEKEKAETEALAQRTLANSIDDKVLEWRRLENERLWIENWKGQVPSTVVGSSENTPLILGIGK